MPRLAKSRETVEIGARLRRVRTAHRVSQTELAKLINVAYQQVQKYENGKNNIAVPMMKKIATALGVKPCQICGCCDE